MLKRISILVFAALLFVGCSWFQKQGEVSVQEPVTQQVQEEKLSAQDHLNRVRDLIEDLKKISEKEEVFRIISVAYAEEELDVEDTVLTIFTELDAAITAIEENSDVDALEELSEVQGEVTDVLDDVSSVVDTVTSELISELSEEVDASNDDVEEALSDIDDAEMIGDEVEIDLDTVLAADVVQDIDGRKRLNREKFIEKRIIKAEARAQDIVEKMRKAGVSEQEIQNFLTEHKERIKNIQTVVASGDFQAAFEDARSLIRNTQEARRALRHVNVLEDRLLELPENTQAIINSLLSQGKTFEAAKTLKEAIYKERKDERNEERGENKKERERVYEGIRAIQQALKEGTITEEDAKIQRDELKATAEAEKEARKVQRKERLENAKTEREVKIMERINSLPEEARQTVLDRFERNKIKKKEVEEKVDELQDQAKERGEDKLEELKERAQELKDRVSQKKNEEEVIDEVPVIQVPVVQAPVVQESNSCFVVTSPVVGQTVSFPLSITGYIDLAAAKSGNCTRWTVFEGIAGRAVVKDVNGDEKSQSATIYAVGGYEDYYLTLQPWPMTATIQGLTDTLSTNQISIYMEDDNASGGIPQTQIISPLNVVTQ